MKPKDITEAKDPDLRASVAAMHRAAELARRTAIQTDTDLVIGKNGKLTRIPAQALRAASNDTKKKELGSDYPKLPTGDNRVPLAIWYANNPGDRGDFEKQMRRKVHYVIRPDHL